MKPNRFVRLFLLLLASSAGMYFFSCQRDTEQTSSSKPFTDSQVIFRDCDDPDYCTCTVTTDANATLDLCGDLPQASPSSCTGCNTVNTGATGAVFVANEPKEFCVDQSVGGNLCITNAGLSSVNVTVQYGNSTPIIIAIGASQTQCFHTDDCNTTESHCQ